MLTLTVHVLSLLFLFGALGFLVGWLIRPFFCKSGSTTGRGNLSGSTNANTKLGKTDASLNTASANKSVNTSYGGSKPANADAGNNNATDDKTSSNNATAAAAGIAAVAATAAAVASNKNDDAKQSEIEADKKRLVAETEAARNAKQAKVNADQAAAEKAKLAKAKDAEAQRLAAEKAKAAKQAEDQRLAAEKAKAAKQAEEQRLAAEKAKAAKQAEEQRLAAEKAKAAKQADDQRIALEKAKAAKLAEEQRLADEKAKADKLSAIEADKKKLAAEAQAVRDAEAARLAAEKAKAEQDAKDAAAKAEADRIAGEKAKAEQDAKDAAAKAEADRLAAEKAKAEQDAKDAAAKAEADRLAAEKAKAEQDAKDAAAKAEADRIAAEKAKAEQDAKDAAAKAEADRIAAEKAKAEQAAKDAAAKAEAARLAAEKAKAEQAAKDAAAEAERSNAAKLAAAAAVTAAAATSAASGSTDADEDDLSSVTDDMRPERLSAPRGGNADDLKRIKGIGPVIEGTLNEEGVYHFQQIASFTPDNVKWVDKNVSIPGRVHRDDWIGQAQSLVDGREYDGYAKDIAGTEDPSLPPVTEDMRPARLSGAIGGKADDLKRINGIGPVIEKTLNNEGIYHFKQIADFTPDNVNWVDRHISFPGRITREEWIRQAKGLAAGENGDALSASAGSNNTNFANEDIVITEDMRPARRSVEAGQKADDLKVINGIGPVIEKSLNEEGVYFYQQIADFDDDNTKWVDNHMAFPGRIHREDWIGQAKILVGQGAEVTITENMRPSRRTLNSGEKADDLKVINGIGPVIEKSLNEEGIYFYQQIADFDEDNTKWVDNHMAFPGRIHREDWIGQAKVLVGQKSSTSTAATSGSGSSSASATTSAVGSGLGSSGAVPDSMKPKLLSSPEGGKADDLKRVKGIGKVLEKNLHAMGIYHYEQLAELTPDNIKWLTDYVSFPEGRIDNENWTGQAKALAEGKQTEYSQRFDKGDTPYK